MSMVFFRRSLLRLFQTIQYPIVHLLIWFIRAIPYKAALSFGRSLGFLAWVLDPFHRKTADIQMKYALGKAYHPLMSLRVFMNHGDILVDTIRFAFMDKEEIRDRIVIEEREHLDRARQSNRGIMLITGHIGNWEILTHLPRILDIEFCVMADIRNDPRLEALINDIRSRSGATILPPKGKALMLIKRLRKGSAIGMVVDQRGKRGERMFCDLFGLPAPTNPAPAFIALKGNAILLPVYAIKKKGSYHICFSPAVDPTAFGTGETSVEELSSYMQSWVASIVLQHPEQWFWLHARWTRRSDMRRIVRKRLDFRKEVLRQYEERRQAP